VPWSASCSASSRPIPVDAPVTITTFSGKGKLSMINAILPERKGNCYENGLLYFLALGWQTGFLFLRLLTPRLAISNSRVSHHHTLRK
jgi:hypothetical protein